MTDETSINLTAADSRRLLSLTNTREEQVAKVFNCLEDNQQILKMEPDRGILDTFYITNAKRQEVMCVSYSGCTSTLALNRMILKQEIHAIRKPSASSVQVAGGSVISGQNYLAYLPLCKESDQRFQEIELTAVSQIITNIPLIDTTLLVQDIYEQYTSHLEKLGQKPRFKISDLPHQYGGQVCLLIPTHIYLPQVLFISREGSTIFRHPYTVKKKIR